MKHLLLLISALVILSGNSFATHLIGGSIGYEYIGKVGNDYRFKVILTTYTNCGASSQIPTPEDPIQPVGIYEHDQSNNPTGGGNKNFLMDLQLNLVSQLVIEPDQPSSCSIGASSCIFKGVYEGFVNLPLNFTGYHVVYERCCRNGSIVNLIPDESMAFYCYISPPLLGNSSPVFTDDPVPFLCVGDTTTILNSAYDPDGDLLTFSFVQPYDGVATNGNPAPAPQNPFLQYPISNVTYAGGYSVSQPFGAGGYSSISASTGLTTYYPPTTGDYVVAVEIKEFRNGNLIGITRRDLQLLVLNCPPNPAPIIDASLGTTNTVFNLIAGETLCFNYGYNDPNGDSVTITSTGAIFDPALTNPPATINSPVSDLDTVSTEFCWTTDCNQARTAPYQFQISARDNGCPPNSANNVYEIYVNPVPPPSSISGADVVCQFSTETYSTQSIPATTYNWSVTGGTIVADNGSSIDVEWTTIGAVSISLSAENQFGCVSEPIDYQVTVTPAPIVNAGNDTTICINDTIQLQGSTSAGPGFTSSWTPNSNMTGSTTLTPSVFPSDTTTYYLLIDIGGGCFGTDSVTVNVNQPLVDAGSDTSLCAGDSVQLQGSVSSGTFTWSPTVTLSDPSLIDPFATPSINTEYILELTDAIGCVNNDTVQVTVTNAFSLTVSNDTTICSGDCANLSASGAVDYVWNTQTTLSDSLIGNPIACPIVTETYQVIGFDGVCSDTAQITVTVGVTPSVEAGNDITLCLGDTTQLLATGATLYSWSPITSLNDPSVADPLAFPTSTIEYFVSGSDALGCTAVDSITVTIVPLPTADAGEDKGICISVTNGTTTPTEVLDGAGTGSPSWSPIIGLSDPNIFNPVFNPSTDTEYVLTVTDVNGCIDMDTVQVTVFGEVPTDAGVDSTICPGDSIIIGGNPSSSGINTTYLWSPAAFLDDATSSNPLAFPTQTTMFYLSTSNDTCNGLDSVLITVRIPPAVFVGIDISICEGDTTQVIASGAVSYVWNEETTLSDSLVSDPLAFPTTTTEYIVTGTDIDGCTNQDTINVFVNATPSISAGNDVSICLGDTAQLLGTGGTTYSWTPTDSINNVVIENPLVWPAITTEYIVLGTDANNCSSQDTVLVTVNSLPIVDAGLNDTICLDETYQLQASGADSYSWTPTTDLDNPNISNPLSSAAVTTTFYVEGTDANMCVNEDSIEIFINALPAIDAGTDATICFNDSTLISATGGIDFIWTPATGLADPNSASTMASPADSTMYYVTGTDVNGCQSMDSVKININPLPLVNAGINDTICFGDTTQLSASGAISYVWTPVDSLSNPNIDNPLAWPSQTTDYIVEGTDANNCVNSDTVEVFVNALPAVEAGANDSICLGDTYQLQATGADTYAWTPSSDLDDPNIFNPVSNATLTTIFFVEGIDGNSCLNIDSVEIFIRQLPIVDAGANTALCIGDTIQLTATGATAYSWTPFNSLSNSSISNPLAFPASLTTYYVIGTDDNNCNNIDSIEVTVNALPTIDAGADQDICIGGNANLLATGAVNYSWSPIATLDNSLISNPVASPDTTQEYIVVGTDANLCVSSDTVIVNVFRISTGPDADICVGDSVQLNVFGSAGNAYSWTPTSGLSDPNIANPMATPVGDITYYVSVSSITGCVDQDSISITINSAPTASFDMFGEPGCEGMYVDFTNTSLDGLEFVWEFNDGESTTEENPTHQFAYNSEYIITLTVTNSNGCVSSASELQTVLDINQYYIIEVPNVFTPNGDGDNELFRPSLQGRFYECAELTIYNRWGQIMFRSSGNNISWDGHTMTGQSCPNGTYMYTLDVNGNKYGGTLMLFR